MHIEFLVEEPSAEACLWNLVPKIVGADVTFAIHPHQGKQDLIKKLPGILRGYKAWLPENWRVVVLIDADREDCKSPKAKMDEIADGASFFTKSAPAGDLRFQVLNRLAVEELEAWFFGDVEALRSAYPRLPASIPARAKFRDPDAIRGGTWEALERLLKRAGSYSAGLGKITVARNISIHLEPDRNRSRSFQVFRDGLRSLVD
jgi:hypothetical protein